MQRRILACARAYAIFYCLVRTLTSWLFGFDLGSKIKTQGEFAETPQAEPSRQECRSLRSLIANSFAFECYENKSSGEQKCSYSLLGSIIKNTLAEWFGLRRILACARAYATFRCLVRTLLLLSFIKI